MKVTPQRVAIFEALLAQPDHPSAEEVYQQVLRRFPMVSFATVYNTLEMLTAMGEVRAVIVDELRRRYDLNVEPHAHAVCRQCHTILDIPLPGGAPSAGRDVEAELGRRGFRWESVELEFRGLCGPCASAPARPAGAAP